MESFRKRDNILYGYYNSEKILKEVTVPDGVEHIDEYAFAERRDEHYEIRRLILPDSLKSIHKSAFWVKPRYYHDIPRADTIKSIYFHGVTFYLNTFSHHYMDKVIDFIADRDYSIALYHELKYPIVLQFFMNEKAPESTAYIKKNFKKIFIWLVGEFNYLFYHSNLENPYDYMKILIDNFISKRNIETYIKIAHENKCNEVLDMLNEYKVANYGKV
ncbi:MAG: leucine-rich repeat domain-containing protein [Ruminococcus flavefaciens]|nr:leucine-rich repeat domain-containing protein [Ruminococcus flavefaciens]